MVAPVIPGEELEFRVLKEDWSKYEILDGKATVWLRAILVKAFEIPPGNIGNPRVEYATHTQTIVTAFFEKSLRGQPGAANYDAKALEETGLEIDTHMLEEPFNEYILSGKSPKLLKTKAVLTGARVHMDKRNAFGDPILHVNSQVVVSRATLAPGHVSK